MKYLKHFESNKTDFEKDGIKIENEYFFNRFIISTKKFNGKSKRIIFDSNTNKITRGDFKDGFGIELLKFLDENEGEISNLFGSPFYKKLVEEIEEKSKYLLPDEEFMKSTDNFDSIVDTLLDYIDDGIKVEFKTSYNNSVSINFDYYMSKNKKYKEFINALYAKGRYIEISFVLKEDFNFLLSFLENLSPTIKRIEEFGWKKYSYKITSKFKKGILVTYEFRRSDDEYFN
jgi:hypothetical protein